MPRGVPNTPQTEAQEAPAKKALKQYRITFHGEGGDVEIGHNHKLNLYKRNEQTTIDENFLDVLRHAVVTTQIQDADGKWKSVSMPQYQYTLEAE
jgi:hypothetical protein